MDLKFQPIGHIDTPFKQKFAIPRQPNLAAVNGNVILDKSIQDDNVFKGLEGFSHVWLLFYFNATAAAGWKPTVKAPRLGGNKTLGVFASRSTHRPNSIGMSVVQQHGWQRKNGLLTLQVSGVDLLDATPILDIKPYLPYADSIASASSPFVDEGGNEIPPTISVKFSAQGIDDLTRHSQSYPELERTINQVLAQDPRPAYKKKLNVDPKQYAVQLYDFDVFWHIEGQGIIVDTIQRLHS